MWLGGGDNECVDSDNRNFLWQHKSHILHYSQIFYDNNLLSHSLAKLSNETKADSRSIPLTSTIMTKKLTLNLRKKC